MPNEARLDILEQRVSMLEDKEKRMTENIHYFRFEMAKYFRKYNQLHQELETTAIETIANYSKELLIKYVKEESQSIDFVQNIKEVIDKWFNEQMQLLARETSPIVQRMDVMEQNFLNYTKYFEEHKNMGIMR